MIQRAFIVLLGSFNPGIMHPDWFERYSILPDDEIAGLMSEPKKKEIPELNLTLEYGQNFTVSSAKSNLTFKSLNLVITRDKFQIRCENSDNFPLMITTVQKIFKMLSQTPIKVYGINFIEHLKCERESQEIINSFFTNGPILGEIFDNDFRSGHTIKTERDEATIVFRVEQSDKLNDGIIFNINNEYELDAIDTDELVGNIEKHFNDSYDFIHSIIENSCGEITERLNTL